MHSMEEVEMGALAETDPPTLTLTVKQAAAVAGISRRDAYDLVANGEIPSVRLGGAIRIPTRRFLAMLAMLDDEDEGG
jgi:excisionase family DNA binding protein